MRPGRGRAAGLLLLAATPALVSAADECPAKGDVCVQVQQVCVDPNPGRAGDWQCRCGAGTFGLGLQEPAVCTPLATPRVRNECVDCVRREVDPPGQPNTRLEGSVTMDPWTISGLTLEECVEQCIWAQSPSGPCVGYAWRPDQPSLLRGCTAGASCCLLKSVAVRLVYTPDSRVAGLVEGVSCYNDACDVIGQECVDPNPSDEDWMCKCKKNGDQRLRGVVDALNCPRREDECAAGNAGDLACAHVDPKYRCYDPDEEWEDDWLCGCMAGWRGGEVMLDLVEAGLPSCSVDECVECPTRLAAEDYKYYTPADVIVVHILSAEECEKSCLFNDACWRWAFPNQQCYQYQVPFNRAWQEIVDPFTYGGVRVDVLSIGCGEICDDDDQLCIDPDPAVPADWQCQCKDNANVVNTAGPVDPVLCVPTSVPVIPTPVPPTAAPPTSTPSTRAPPTSVPETPEPPQPAAPTALPQGKSFTDTPGPMLRDTSAPATDVPTTLAPVVPATDAPPEPATGVPTPEPARVLVPVPVPVPPTSNTTATPVSLMQTHTEATEFVKNTAAGAAGAALVGGAAGTAMSGIRLALTASACDPELVDPARRYHRFMSPTQLVIADSHAMGAVVGNTAVFAAALVLSYTLSLILGLVGPRLFPSFFTGRDMLGEAAFPSVPIKVHFVLMLGTTLAATELLLHPDKAGGFALGFLGAVLCVGVLVYTFRVMTYVVPRYAFLATDVSTKHWFAVFAIGRGEWLARDRRYHIVKRWSSILRPHLFRSRWFACLDSVGALTIAVLHAPYPDTMTGCGHIKFFSGCVLATMLGLEVYLQPHRHNRSLVLDVIALVLQTAGSFLHAMAYYSETPDHDCFTIGRKMFVYAAFVILVRCITDAAVQVYVYMSKRSKRLMPMGADAQRKAGVGTTLVPPREDEMLMEIGSASGSDEDDRGGDDKDDRLSNSACYLPPSAAMVDGSPAPAFTQPHRLEWDDEYDDFILTSGGLLDTISGGADAAGVIPADPRPSAASATEAARTEPPRGYQTLRRPTGTPAQFPRDTSWPSFDGARPDAAAGGGDVASPQARPAMERRVSVPPASPANPLLLSTSSVTLQKRGKGDRAASVAVPRCTSDTPVAGGRLRLASMPPLERKASAPPNASPDGLLLASQHISSFGRRRPAQPGVPAEPPSETNSPMDGSLAPLNLTTRSVPALSLVSRTSIAEGLCIERRSSVPLAGTHDVGAPTLSLTSRLTQLAATGSSDSSEMNTPQDAALSSTQPRSTPLLPARPSVVELLDRKASAAPCSPEKTVGGLAQQLLFGTRRGMGSEPPPPPDSTTTSPLEGHLGGGMSLSLTARSVPAGGVKRQGLRGRVGGAGDSGRVSMVGPARPGLDRVTSTSSLTQLPAQAAPAAAASPGDTERERGGSVKRKSVLRSPGLVSGSSQHTPAAMPDPLDAAAPFARRGTTLRSPSLLPQQGPLLDIISSLATPQEERLTVFQPGTTAEAVAED